MKVVILGGGIAGITLGIFLHRKDFDVVINERSVCVSARGNAFLMHSEGLTVLKEISDDYTKNKISLGVRFTYFGNVVLTGFGDPDYDGIYPMVPVDDQKTATNTVNFNNGTYVPEIFNYKGKLTTDLYANAQLSKKVSLVIGADNIFNIHPDFAVNPQAKWYAGDNETGGPWDGVQMGYNGLRIFSKLVFKF